MSKKKVMIAQLLQEDLERFNNINGYINPLSEQFLGLGGNTPTFQLEQEETSDEEVTDDLSVALEDTVEEEPADTAVEGEPADTGATDEENTEVSLDIGVEEESGDIAGGNTEELDVTELVTMSKESGEKADALEQSIKTQSGTIDSLLSKLDDLEAKLGEMDKIVSSVDKLEDKIEKYRPQTPQEKLELRYLDSGPFNQSPHQYWDNKQEELKKQKDKHEYVLTAGEVDDYNESDIKTSWVYDPEEED